MIVKTTMEEHHSPNPPLPLRLDSTNICTCSLNLPISILCISIKRLLSSNSFNIPCTFDRAVAASIIGRVLPRITFPGAFPCCLDDGRKCCEEPPSDAVETLRTTFLDVLPRSTAVETDLLDAAIEFDSGRGSDVVEDDVEDLGLGGRMAL